MDWEHASDQIYDRIEDLVEQGLDRSYTINVINDVRERLLSELEEDTD